MNNHTQDLDKAKEEWLAVRRSWAGKSSDDDALWERVKNKIIQRQVYQQPEPTGKEARHLERLEDKERREVKKLEYFEEKARQEIESSKEARHNANIREDYMLMGAGIGGVIGGLPGAFVGAVVGRWFKS